MCSSCGRGETGCLGRGPWGLSGPRRVGSHLEGLDLQGGVGLCDSAADISVERCSWGRAAWCFGKSRGLESSRGSALCLWACHSALWALVSSPLKEVVSLNDPTVLTA